MSSRFFCSTFRINNSSSVLAYAYRPKEDQTKCELVLFTEKQTATTFVENLPPEQAARVTPMLESLPCSSQDGLLRLSGPVAFTLAYCLEEFTQAPMNIGLPLKNQICFIWNPIEGVSSGGMVCLYLQDRGFELAVLPSREQAIAWVDASKDLTQGQKELLVAKVGDWPADPSHEEMEIIDGLPAQILATAALVFEKRKQQVH